MNQLRRRSLASLPLAEPCVQSFYDGTHSGTEKQCLRALCESHERLRAEANGAIFMWEQDERRLNAALALTDTGSNEFKAAFPPKNAAEGQCQQIHQESVPGWRVVEKIRDVLLDGISERSWKPGMGWPDLATERRMIADADLLASEFEETSTGADAALHIRALLGRVRNLERAMRHAADCSTLGMVKDIARGMAVIE